MLLWAQQCCGDSAPPLHLERLAMLLLLLLLLPQVAAYEQAYSLVSGSMMALSAGLHDVHIDYRANSAHRVLVLRFAGVAAP